MDIVGPPQFARALRSRPFAWLWAGQTISTLGNGAYLTALSWQVLLLTHSGTDMGLVLVATSVPQLIFLLVGGVVADRLPRRQVMLWSDTGRAVVVLGIAALGWLGSLQFWQIILLALVFGAISAFFLPAYQAIPPQLVPQSDLPSANALTGLSQEAGLLLGPIIGAGLVAILSPAAAFAFDGLTFMISAGCLLALRLPPHSKPGLPISAGNDDVAMAPDLALKQKRSRPDIGAVLDDIREGLDYILRSTWLFVIIAIASVANIGFSTLNVALPKLVHDEYHSGVWLLGLISASLAVGTIAATLAVGQMKHLRHRGLIANLGTLLASIGLILLGLPLASDIEPVMGSLAAALIGIGVGTFSIIWVTVLQEMVPADKQGRVFSIDMMGSFALQPIGFLIVGIATDRAGPASVFIAGGILNVALTLLALSVRGVRDLQ